MTEPQTAARAASAERTRDEAAFARDAQSSGAHPHRWWILAVLSLAQLMVVLDATVVNIALPSAQRDLGFGNADRQWIVTAYALAFGSLLLLGGRLGDLLGVKRTFLIGLTGFAVASAVGGASTSFAMLVTSRAVQGGFGAFLAPAALSLLSTTFTDLRERSRAFGIFSAVMGSGAAIGLLLGGVLTEYLSWRWCMYVNLVFAVGAFAGGMLLLTARRSAHRTPLDVPGAILAAAGVFGLVFGFSRADTDGWHSGQTLGFIAAGAVLLVAFVGVETRVAHPLLPMRVVLDRNRGGAYLAVFVAAMGMFGVFLFLTYFLQVNLGFSAVLSGVAFLPMVGCLAVMSQLGLNVFARYVGPRWLVLPGMLAAAGGMYWLAQLSPSSGYAGGVLPGLMIFGAGLGLTFSGAMSNATYGVDPADAGVASAMVNTGQQVGGSIGTALLSTLAATSLSRYLTAHGAGPVQQLHATVHSYDVVFSISALILLVGALLAGSLLRGTPTTAPAGPEVVGG